ncbi:hypothetical protein ABI_27130 [Asticcacaulis biprosthecium C19]|uniref:Uncharacterized protein n=1 Tax=Asticcacaulis biprosthecium C19 TaxID=715226 RepID=F4QM57_9CAUL|nr:hypothetical protein [Asticcacaulis biprosthecium]EGF91298.1 hypothetical protein ABI_27130 [Asticcacaulis biprosthecium C19]
MGVIANKRLGLIKGLVKTLPQTSLRSLEMALGLTKDEALVEVRNLVSLELEFRHVKQAVFAPYLPLLEARPDGLTGITFPAWLLDNIWSALEVREPELYMQSRYALRGLRTEDPTPVVFFRLVTAAAQICRENPHDILPAKPDAADGEAVTEFALYLDLHRIARAMLARLPDFLGRIDADRATALRLMFKDACANDSEGGYRLLEILFANLEDGPQIVKFVATVSDRASERFLAASELAVFGERILAVAEERLLDLKTFMGARGKVCDDLGIAGQKVSDCLALIHSFENYIELQRDGPWGKRLAAGHKLIAELVESQLKGAERALEDALPMKSERVYGRVRKETPHLDRFPKPEAIVRAVQTLAFVKTVRNVAHAGGFASLHTKTAQALESALDSYFEELLSIANGDEPVDPEVVMSFFELVTDLMQALCGEEKAAVGRRRIASSDLLKPKNVA